MSPAGNGVPLEMVTSTDPAPTVSTKASAPSARLRRPLASADLGTTGGSHAAGRQLIVQPCPRAPTSPGVVGTVPLELEGENRWVAACCRSRDDLNKHPRRPRRKSNFLRHSRGTPPLRAPDY